MFFKKILPLIFLSLSTFSILFAEQSMVSSFSNTKEKGEVTILATVDIYHAIIIQKGNDVTLSFDIHNKTGVQPGVKYGVILVKETDQGQVVVDEHIYDEVISINENSSVHKVVSYKAPVYLEGEFKIFVSSKNTSGFPFGTAYAGIVSFIKNKETDSPLLIDTTSCFLTIENEKSTRKQTKAQGIDVSSEETILSNCMVSNNTNKEIKVTPSFMTRQHSSFGDFVETTGGDFSVITFKPNEKKMVVTKLPKAKISQSYKVNLRYGKEGNEMSYYYHIKGVNATIENIIFDKNIYQKNEIAKLSFIWRYSGDFFPDQRKGTSTELISPSYSILITDENHKKCTPSIAQSLKKEIRTELEIQMGSYCRNPKAEITLYDEKLQIVAHSYFETFGASTTLPINKINNLYLFGNLFSASLLLLGIYLFLFLKRRKSMKGSIIALFLFLFLFSKIEEVKALTADLNRPYGSHSDAVRVTVNLGSDTYNKNTEIGVTYSMDLPYIGSFCCYTYWTYYSTKEIAQTLILSPYTRIAGAASAFMSGFHFTAPNVLGSNYLIFTVYSDGPGGYGRPSSYYGNIFLPFTVVDQPPPSCTHLGSFIPTTVSGNDCSYLCGDTTGKNAIGNTSVCFNSTPNYTGSLDRICDSTGTWVISSKTCTAATSPPTVEIKFSFFEKVRNIFQEMFTRT